MQELSAHSQPVVVTLQKSERDLVGVGDAHRQGVSGRVGTVLAVVCPGQGSQTPAMLEPWLTLPSVREFLGELSEASGVDLIAHGTTSDADTIRDTAVAQPLIVASSLMAWHALTHGKTTATPHVVAGHSVGEFAASALAGVMTNAQATALVTHRARAMAQAASAHATGMAAVVGGQPDDVLASIAAAGLTPANMNSPQQVVAAGSLDGIAALQASPPARARVIALQVAGAFHTEFMAPAQDTFRDVARGWPVADPTLTLLSNRDGRAFTDGAHGYGRGQDVLDSLVHQITSPVRWDLCQHTLADLGVTGVLELAPGGVLTGLAKRTLKGVATCAISSPDDLPTAHDFITEHA